MSKQPAKKAPAASKTIVHPVAITVEGDELVAKGAGQEARSKIPAARPATMLVVFLRSHPGYGNWPGDEADVEAVAAAALVAEGFARKA